jgi:hypothetical protein
MTRRIGLTAETWHALDDLQYQTGQPLNELAEEAFADLIKKRRQPRSLREALLRGAAPQSGSLRRRLLGSRW